MEDIILCTRIIFSVIHTVSPTSLNSNYILIIGTLFS